MQCALQSRTGKYRGLQGNPCNESRIPAMRTGFPVMKTDFSLWELTYREFPVSLTGFGFAVCQKEIVDLMNLQHFSLKFVIFNLIESRDLSYNSKYQSTRWALWFEKDRNNAKMFVNRLCRQILRLIKGKPRWKPSGISIILVGPCLFGGHNLKLSFLVLIGLIY